MLAWLAAVGAVVLVHTAPFPFLLDVTDRTVWRMPQHEPPTVYLTFDDGPNPTATPDLLDTLARHRVPATFFIIDKHLTADTAPLVRRTFDEGHAVALETPRQLTLELALEFIVDDELVEITPKSMRLRKRFLKAHERKKASRKAG